MAFISVKWKKGRDAEQLGIEMTLRKRIISGLLPIDTPQIQRKIFINEE